MTTVKTYDLKGKYSKLFDAQRGKYARARSRALFQAQELVPTFETYEYFSGSSILKITYSTAPSYLVEDDLFDIFEQHFNQAA